MEARLGSRKEPVERGATSPLTQAELGLWYAQHVDPGNPVFNTGQYLDIRGPLDAEAFRLAVDTVMREADALATRVVATGAVPARVIDERLRPLLQRVDLRSSTSAEADAHAWMTRDMATPIDPSRDALAVQVLFTLSPDRHLWYQRIHHLAIDGYGTALLVGRVCDLYRASVTGEAARTVPFAALETVVAAEAGYLASDRHATDRQFWLDQFADRPEPASLSAGTAMTVRHYLTRGVDLPASAGEALAALAAKTDVAWPDVLVALSAAYLHRHTGGDEAIVGVPSMERLGRAAARVPAMVMNILPARIAIDEDASMGEWLTRTARHLQRLRRHGRYRGEQLRRDLGLLGGQRRLHGPLINVLPFDAPVDLPGLQASLHVLATGPVDDLTITWRADGAGRGLRLELDGNPLLYTEADLEAHAARLSAFLANALGASTPGEVPTLPPDEAARWIHEVNATAHPVADVTLTQLIEARMRETPDAPALRFEGRTWSYRELDIRTLRLARELTARGAGPGHIVGVMAPRSFELVLALVGVLRAGAAYLPVDPDYPADRVSTVITSARPTLVLTLGDAGRHVPHGVVTLALESMDGHANDALPAPIAPGPGDAAYVIYTSGSTGTPKGAVIEHRAIVNRLEWMRTFYGFAPDDRLLQKTPATFDVSVWEFFLAFTTGASLVIAPPDAHKDPAWLAAIVREEAITTLHFVPSMLAVFLAEPAAAGLSLRRVFCSGEELPATLRDHFHEVIDAELHNLYGPTEAAVDVTWWNASRGDRSVPVPIGFPVWNTQMYVLDSRLRAVPDGVTGDLYIAGVQLAREYLNQPELTAERFVPNPFGPPGSRMYQTGDLARWRPDGAITFLGRSDFQVKIRGFRIELGEIEAVIAATGAVTQVAVVAREDRPGDKYLAAYIVAREAGVDVDVLRARVADRLPDYMVPSAFVVLDALPLSANGKLQRNALPVPDRAATATPARAPRTATEAALLDLFSDVLDLPPAPDGAARFGIDDDFFVLGGHSLLGAQLMTRIRERWNVDGGLGVIFAHPTVARLAERLDRADDASPAGAMADVGLGPTIHLVRVPDSTRAPVFCIHPAGGLSWCYGRLARALEPARDVHGLQAIGLDVAATLPDSIDAMAADYVDRMRAIQPTGPYSMLGWSVGGIIAHAMGVRLRRIGERVDMLAMLDAYPCDRWRDQPPPDEETALRALLLIAGHDPDALSDRSPGAREPLTRDSVMRFLREAGHPLGTLTDEALSGIVRVVHHNSALVRRHQHAVYDGDVLYFRAALDHAGTTLSPDEWQPYVAGRLDVHDIPALHAHLTGAAASAAIAAVVNTRLQRA